LIVRKLLGSEAEDGILLDEKIRLDSTTKLLLARSINRDFRKFVTTSDQRWYSVHPDNPEWTLFCCKGLVSAHPACTFLRGTVREWATKNFRQQAEEAAQDFANKLDEHA